MIDLGAMAGLTSLRLQRRMCLAALPLLALHAGTRVLHAQTSSDSAAVLGMVADYAIRHSVSDSLTGLRTGGDSLLMPGARSALPRSGPPGASIERLISALPDRSGRLLAPVPAPVPGESWEVAARREVQFKTVHALGGLFIGRDSAIALIRTVYNHEPRPSTYTSIEHRLQFTRTGPGRWRLAGDSLLVVTDGFYGFAPPENLPPELRDLRRGRPPPR